MGARKTDRGLRQAQSPASDLDQRLCAGVPAERRRAQDLEHREPDRRFVLDVAWEAEPGRIFCCSRIMARKNIIGMIDAFALLVRRLPHCRLRIAGTAEPRYLRACRARI